MNGITIGEARLLDKALSVLPGDTDWTFDERERDLAASLRRDLADFITRVENTSNTLELWTDGAARPTNPGPAGIGIVGKVAGRTVFEIAQYIGRTTNNVAEYKAAVEGFRRAVDLEAKHVVLHSDSKMLVDQFHNRIQCRDEGLKPLLGRLRGLAQRFESVKVEWIPREQNREADGLSVAGAYQPRECGACRHAWHTSFCTEDAGNGTACGCPYGFKGGIEA